VKSSKDKRSADRDRFYVQSDKHHLFQQLSQGTEAPFSTITNVFVVAAALGYRAGTKKALKGTQHVGFWRSFSIQEDVPLLQAIAVADTGDVEVLADQGEVISVAEQYANVGIDLLTEMVRADRDRTVRSMAAAIVQS
jgi:dnd system-associated protein 4